MKILVRILSVYLLLLSLVPCADGNGGLVELISHTFQDEETHVHKHANDHDDQDNDCGEDPCTPFCICSCCSLTLNIPVKQMVLVQITDLNPIRTPVNIPNMISYQAARSIWDPPQYS